MHSDPLTSRDTIASKNVIHVSLNHTIYSLEMTLNKIKKHVLKMNLSKEKTCWHFSFP